MKLLCTITLLLLAVLTSPAQQVFVDPTSVTLTKQQNVTIIVTAAVVGAYEYGNTGRTTPPIHVSVGTVKATYYFAIGTSMSELGVVTGITASSVATGTLDAGTYQVASDATVATQVTVILWGESSGGGLTLSDVTLAYENANATDQSNFQSLITSLVQSQLTTMQNQIDSQQTQLATLQQLTSALQSTLSSLIQSQSNTQSQTDAQQAQLATIQAALANQQAAITALQQSLADHQTQYSNLSDSLTTLTTRVTTLESRSTSTASSSKKSDSTWTWLGLGLGGAGVLGSVAHFFIGNDGDTGDTSSTDALVFPEGSEK